MDKELIKKYQKNIKEVSSQDEKQAIASQLHAYIGTLSVDEQKVYKASVLANIESKFEVMDKLIAAYEAIKKDDFQLV